MHRILALTLFLSLVIEWNFTSYYLQVLTFSHLLDPLCNSTFISSARQCVDGLTKGFYETLFSKKCSVTKIFYCSGILGGFSGIGNKDTESDDAASDDAGSNDDNPVEKVKEKLGSLKQ